MDLVRPTSVSFLMHSLYPWHQSFEGLVVEHLQCHHAKAIDIGPLRYATEQRFNLHHTIDITSTQLNLVDPAMSELLYCSKLFPFNTKCILLKMLKCPNFTKGLK